MPFDGQTDEIGQVLRAAADLIRKYGHTKGVRRDTAGRLCLHGALEMAIIRGRPFFDVSELAASKRIHEFAGIGAPVGRGYSLAQWNNADERTAEEVIAVLDGAANFRKETTNAV